MYHIFAPVTKSKIWLIQKEKILNIKLKKKKGITGILENIPNIRTSAECSRQTCGLSFG